MLTTNYTCFDEQALFTTQKDIDKTAQFVVKLLREEKLHVAFAESCTGGMISAAVTGVAGVSEVLDLSMTAYANSAKVKFTDVTEEMLTRCGAVSAETAAAMASGVRRLAGAGIGAAVTGIAGPGGGSAEKPVGTVYIAVDYNGDIAVKRFAFGGGRMEVRGETTRQTLILIKDEIIKRRNRLWL